MMCCLDDKIPCATDMVESHYTNVNTESMRKIFFIVQRK